jgi:hypothetical protein
VTVVGSEVNRWGVGVVQEIDSAAMHVFARWQHLDVNLDARCFESACLSGNHFVGPGDKVKTDYEDLELFQVGGVIFF